MYTFFLFGKFENQIIAPSLNPDYILMKEMNSKNEKEKLTE